MLATRGEPTCDIQLISTSPIRPAIAITIAISRASPPAIAKAANGPMARIGSSRSCGSHSAILILRCGHHPHKFRLHPKRRRYPALLSSLGRRILFRNRGYRANRPHGGGGAVLSRRPWRIAEATLLGCHDTRSIRSTGGRQQEPTAGRSLPGPRIRTRSRHRSIRIGRCPMADTGGSRQDLW
jgi:hypothetical protein